MVMGRRAWMVMDHLHCWHTFSSDWEGLCFSLGQYGFSLVSYHLVGAMYPPQDE